MGLFYNIKKVIKGDVYRENKLIAENAVIYLERAEYYKEKILIHNWINKATISITLLISRILFGDEWDLDGRGKEVFKEYRCVVNKINIENVNELFRIILGLYLYLFLYNSKFDIYEEYISISNELEQAVQNVFEFSIKDNKLWEEIIPMIKCEDSRYLMSIEKNMRKAINSKDTEVDISNLIVINAVLVESYISFLNTLSK